MNRLSAIRIFYWFLFTLFLSLIQLVILFLTLYIRDITFPIDLLIKDGVLFFFATALVGNAFFDLWDAKRLPAEGFVTIFCILVPLIVVFLTLMTYPSMIADALLQDSTVHPINLNKLRFAEIAVAILAILYSFVVKLLMIPRRPNRLSIEEE